MSCQVTRCRTCSVKMKACKLKDGQCPNCYNASKPK